MARPVPRKVAFVVAGSFTVIGIVLGAFRVIPDGVRVAAVYPILLAGMVIALWDVTSNSPRTQSVAGALLLVAGSVIVGYRSTADAMKEPVLAIIVFGSGGLALATGFTIVANYWIGSTKANTSRIADSASPSLKPAIKPEQSDTENDGGTGG